MQSAHGGIILYQLVKETPWKGDLSIEGRKGELRYLGEEWWAAGGRSSKKAWMEASKGCGEGAGDGSRAVEGALKAGKDLAFYEKKSSLYTCGFPAPEYCLYQLTPMSLAFPCLLFFTFPQCRTNLDGFMSFILWFISLIWRLCPLLTFHFHTRVPPKNVIMWSQLCWNGPDQDHH